MKKRVLLIVLAMVLVAALSVGLTLAYLTDHEAVTNTFTVGKVGITLDEAVVNQYGEPVDANGNKVDVANAARTNTGNQYDPATGLGGYKLIPGHTYVKDPTVTVAADSESSYIRMIVKVSDYADLVAALEGKKADNGHDCVAVVNGQKIVLLQNLVSGWDDALWVSTKVVNVDTTKNEATYEFRYATPISTVDKEALTLDALFDTFTFPSAVIGTHLNALEELQINVEAHAIQAMGFDNADDAWANFKK